VWERTLLDPCHLHNERILDRVIGRLRRDGIAPRAGSIFAEYQRWRCRYVIATTPNGFVRDVYRALRKAGLGSWVAARYDRAGQARTDGTRG